MNRTILSLCDYSGEWPRPYKEAGYNVIQVDIQFGQDVRLFEYIGDVYGILAAPPCTHLASSGARWWKQKGEEALIENLSIVDACLRIIAMHNPAFWALENPVGRLRRYLGTPTLIFDPYYYGDPYTKKTLLWGKFNIPKKNKVEPVKVCEQGSWIQKLGGGSGLKRSITPAGFARAFFEANK